MNHGTVSTYTHHGCRCEICLMAGRAYFRQRRARLASQPVPPWIEHGRNNTYTNYSCRCRSCKAAHATYQRERWNKINANS